LLKLQKTNGIVLKRCKQEPAQPRSWLWERSLPSK